MSFEVLIMLLGGLTLFLYGMQMMSTGLEVAAGNKLKEILERLTSKPLLGILVGTLITAIIQSSSATTVMVVGFVNSGIMSLSRAVWIIMGANIGTTITSQLFALDIHTLAPLFAFIGVIMVLFFKNNRINCIGDILTGLGILFFGMNFMSDAMIPLQESETFVAIITSFQNPLIGILAGAIFTAVVQSSSASIAILQALAASGAISLNGAVYVLFGQNIGTCVTSIIASIGTSRNAKRTTLIHLLFNVIGTVIFVILFLVFPIVEWIQLYTENDMTSQIANIHTLFNISTTLMLLPFAGKLVTLTKRLIPGEDKHDYPETLIFTSDHSMGGTAIAISQLQHELLHMLTLANRNFQKVFSSIIYERPLDTEGIVKNEEALDAMNHKLAHYVSQVSSYHLSEDDSNVVNSLFKLTSDIERIGDHSFNIFETAQVLREQHITFSTAAISEMTELHTLLSQAFDTLHQSRISSLADDLRCLKAIDDELNMMNEEFRGNLMIRMNKQCCAVESAFAYNQLLIDVKRISDHIVNIIEVLEHTQITLTDK